MRAKPFVAEGHTSQRLYESQLDNYAICAADTEELRDLCHRLRYQVYCIENEYESKAENPNLLERDRFDEFSAHAVVIHRPTNMAAGTVRLILPRAPLEPPLPFLAACSEPNWPSNPAFPVAQTAEISRFAISKKFRRATRDPGNEGPSAGDVDIITLALIRAFVGLAAKHDVQFFCAMMERALLRRVARLGIYFDRVGDDVEFHGRRQPSAIGVSDMLDRVRREREDVWRIITDNGAYVSAFSKPLAAE